MIAALHGVDQLFVAGRALRCQPRARAGASADRAGSRRWNDA
jgi:hypothetical protein